MRKLGLLFLLVAVSCTTNTSKHRPRKLYITPPNNANNKHYDEDVTLTYTDAAGEKKIVSIPVPNRPDQIIFKGKADNSIFQSSGPTLADRQLLPKQAPQMAGNNDVAESLNNNSLNEINISYLKTIQNVDQLYNEKKYTKALINLAPLIDKFPTKVRPYLMQGTLYKEIGEFRAAITSFEKAKTLDPQNMSIDEMIMSLKEKIGAEL